MKKQTLIILGLLLLTLISCDPPYSDLRPAGTLYLKGTFDNTSESIDLGDTLTLSVPFPDSITDTDGTKIAVESLQNAVFYMDVIEVDTVEKRVIKLFPPTYWVSKGSLFQSSFFNFAKNGPPFICEIKFLPPKRGIYYLDVWMQEGVASFNRNRSAALIVGFDVEDYHLDLAAKYLSHDPYDMEEWKTALMDKNKKGHGVYLFRVK
jgi:hypothetical protein